MKICYHGTSEENAESILRTGFREGTWFAVSLQDALAYGGPHVFEVAFDDPPDNWQFMSRAVGPERIVNYSVIERKVVFDNKLLRNRVFVSNLG